MKSNPSPFLCLALSGLISLPVQAGVLPWEDYRAPTFDEPLMDRVVTHAPPVATQLPVPAGYARPNPPPRAPHVAGCAGGQFSFDACILRSPASRQGLLQQVDYLSRQDLQARVAPGWAGLSNGALLQTAQELLSWEGNHSPYAFQERFDLREVPSAQRSDQAQYTGYFTPLVEVRLRPDGRFRFPVYGVPSGPDRLLSRAQITQGALSGKGMEIAWTDDPVNLYFAHIQGSALARFGDGSEAVMDYAGSNERPHVSLGNHLRRLGYGGSLSNASIRGWLHQHPEHIAAVLGNNPRYIYFQFTNHTPRTAAGLGAIPWHTVAVDDHFIPLGAVLLAEMPRIDARGMVVGSTWRLLFAQDKGQAIKGPGRLDFYTGAGGLAEQATYHLTGFRKTYLLVSKPGFNGAGFAGL